MPLDPNLAGMLKAMRAQGLPPLHAGGAQAAREQLRALTAGTRTPEQVVPVGAVVDRTIDGPGSVLKLRIYRPVGSGPAPVTVFFHGGGWVIGDLETHDNIARTICSTSRTIVVAVDYRLAPEDPFPAAVDDAIFATRWVVKNGQSLGGNGRLGLAGDSAGGNLAAVVAQALHADHVNVQGQLLAYPAVDFGGDYASRREFATGYFIEADTGAWFAKCYLADWRDAADPRLSPLRARDLSGIAPAVIVTAEYDQLRDEGEAYAKALAAAGVKVELERCSGMIHAFFDMGAISPAAQAAVDRNCRRFGELLRA